MAIGSAALSAIGMTHPSSFSSVSAGDGAEEERSEAEDRNMLKSSLVLTSESLDVKPESVVKFSELPRVSVVSAMQCGVASVGDGHASPCDGWDDDEVSESECFRIRFSSSSVE